MYNDQRDIQPEAIYEVLESLDLTAYNLPKNLSKEVFQITINELTRSVDSIATITSSIAFIIISILLRKNRLEALYPNSREVAASLTILGSFLLALFDSVKWSLNRDRKRYKDIIKDVLMQNEISSGDYVKHKLISPLNYLAKLLARINESDPEVEFNKLMLWLLDHS